MAKLLEGKPIAEKIRALLEAEIRQLKAEHGLHPKLVALQIGENTVSEVYIRNQKKTAESLGINYELRSIPDTSSQADVVKVIDGLNKDASVTAVILQLPVPGHIDAARTIGLIAPEKDAEGINNRNICKIVFGDCSIGPCTAMAVMEMISSTGVKLHGKEAVVVGHSDIVGKPVSLMLINNLATTTVCHIATSERGHLAEHVKRAEILVVAVGKAGLIKGEWIRQDAIVIDVGINKVGGKIVGDVEFDEAQARASFITPVPGGVGPLTTMMLMRNTVEQFKAQLREKKR